MAIPSRRPATRHPRFTCTGTPNSCRQANHRISIREAEERVDDTELTDIPDTIGYLSLSEWPIDKIAEFLVKKLNA